MVAGTREIGRSDNFYSTVDTSKVDENSFTLALVSQNNSSENKSLSKSKGSTDFASDLKSLNQKLSGLIKAGDPGKADTLEKLSADYQIITDSSKYRRLITSVESKNNSATEQSWINERYTVSYMPTLLNRAIALFKENPSEANLSALKTIQEATFDVLDTVDGSLQIAVHNEDISRRSSVNKTFQANVAPNYRERGKLIADSNKAFALVEASLSLTKPGGTVTPGESNFDKFLNFAAGLSGATTVPDVLQSLVYANTNNTLTDYGKAKIAFFTGNFGKDSLGVNEGSNSFKAGQVAGLLLGAAFVAKSGWRALVERGLIEGPGASKAAQEIAQDAVGQAPKAKSPATAGEMPWTNQPLSNDLKTALGQAYKAANNEAIAQTGKPLDPQKWYEGLLKPEPEVKVNAGSSQMERSTAKKPTVEVERAETWGKDYPGEAVNNIVPFKRLGRQPVISPNKEVPTTNPANNEEWNIRWSDGSSGTYNKESGRRTSVLQESGGGNLPPPRVPPRWKGGDSWDYGNGSGDENVKKPDRGVWAKGGFVLTGIASLVGVGIYAYRYFQQPDLIQQGKAVLTPEMQTARKYLAAYKIMMGEGSGQTQPYDPASSSTYGQEFGKANQGSLESPDTQVFKNPEEEKRFLESVYFNPLIDSLSPNVKSKAKEAYKSAWSTQIVQFQNAINTGYAINANTERLIHLAMNSGQSVSAAPGTELSFVNTLSGLNNNTVSNVNSYVTGLVSPSQLRENTRVTNDVAKTNTTNSITGSAANTKLSAIVSKVNTAQSNVDTLDRELKSKTAALDTQLQSVVTNIKQDYYNIFQGTSPKAQQLNWAEYGVYAGDYSNIPLAFASTSGDGIPIAGQAGPSSPEGIVLRYMIENNIPVPGLPSGFYNAGQGADAFKKIPLTASEANQAKDYIEKGEHLPHFISDTEYINAIAKQSGQYQSNLTDINALKSDLSAAKAELKGYQAQEQAARKLVNQSIPFSKP